MQRAALVETAFGLALLAAGCVSPVEITPADLPDGAVGVTYAAQLYASTENAVDWRVGDGQLPPGIALNRSAGRLAGMPSQAGTYSFTIVAVGDGLGVARGEASYSITIATALTLDANLAPARINEVYNDSIAASGGTPPYTFQVLGLPAGMMYDAATGAITGTPIDVIPRTTLSVTVTDSGSPQQAVATTTGFVVKGPPLTVATTALPDAVAGSTNYSAMLQAAEGRPPYKWAIVAGILPDGLELNLNTGLISNRRDPGSNVLVPVGGGQAKWEFTAKVTDSDSPPVSVTKELTIHVTQPAR
jgi:large repetitive protein